MNVRPDLHLLCKPQEVKMGGWESVSYSELYGILCSHYDYLWLSFALVRPT